MAAANRSAYIYTGSKWEELDQSYNAWLLQFEQECTQQRIQQGFHIDLTRMESERREINSRLAYYMLSMRRKDTQIRERMIIFEDSECECQLIWAPSNANHAQWCRGKFQTGMMQGSDMLREAREG